MKPPGSQGTRRFLRAGNLHSAKLVFDRQDRDEWKEEGRLLAHAYAREATTALKYRGYRLAGQHAEQARSLLPENSAQMWRLTALAARGLGHWPEALGAIEKAIALEPDNAEFRHEKALVLAAQGKEQPSTGKR